MRRTLAALLVALATGAVAQPGKVARVGYVGFLGEPREASPLREAFVAGLRDLGYIAGRNMILEVRRYASEEELQNGLRDLERLKTDVIFVGPPLAASMATRLTKDIPIVCGSCGDPVENGLAASLAKPGGRVTGLASLSAELIGKRIALVKELFPGTTHVAVLVFPANPGTRATLGALDAASRTLGVNIYRREVRVAADFDAGFKSAAAAGATAVVVQDDPLVRAARQRIAELSLSHRLPVSAGLQEVGEAGGLITYGPDRVRMTRRAAVFVDKILKGARPADLPFEQADKLDLIVNLRAAKALGLAIPQGFLIRADRVIQ